ncbi:MAG: DUF4440 domain-containing protein [bacterium]|nr:DUF4440 domain-containing protein [bacterium]
MSEEKPLSLEQAAASLITRFVNAFNRSDEALCEEFYTEDALVLLAAREPLQGHDEIKAAMSAYAGAKLTRSDPIVVSESGDLGYYAVRYEFEAPSASGSASKETGKSLVVLRRQADGSWKVAVDAAIMDA